MSLKCRRIKGKTQKSSHMSIFPDVRDDLKVRILICHVATTPVSPPGHLGSLWLCLTVSCRSWLKWRAAPGCCLLNGNLPVPRSLSWRSMLPVMMRCCHFSLLVVYCLLVTWFCWVLSCSVNLKKTVFCLHLSGLICCHSEGPYCDTV